MAVTRFNVVIDAPLTAKQKNAINKDLQAIASKHIARIDNKAILGTKLVPKEWLGIWIKRFATLEALRNAKTYSKGR